MFLISFSIGASYLFVSVFASTFRFVRVLAQYP